MGGIVGWLFRKVDFDAESLKTLKELSGKGMLVFASFQESNTSLLIFSSLLKRHGLAVPTLALGFRPYLVQRVANVFGRIVSAFGSEKQGRGPVVSDCDFVHDELASGESLVFSFYSQELFTRRYLDRSSDLLLWLLSIQRKSSDPIYLLPKIVFWNRKTPKNQDHRNVQSDRRQEPRFGFFHH
jgi:hypothetical protein